MSSPVLTYLEWVDSQSLSAEGPWATIEDGDLSTELPTICSIGFVLNESDAGILLAAHVDKQAVTDTAFDDTEVGGTMLVPKAAITRRLDFPLPRARRKAKPVTP